MMPKSEGSFHFFRFRGIDVYVHWSWFVIAIYSVSQRVPSYESPLWALGEYLTLFAIVTLHEFGHALACRQVGGSANHIVLWPLGGVAFVAPPQRPGATLWSIAAGPLVNLALLPLLLGGAWACGKAGLFVNNPDFARFVQAVIWIDVSLFVFNMLPLYPLDGGQILRSLLWYPLGRGRSLRIATLIGVAGGVALIALAIWWTSIWTGVLAAFLMMQSWGSYRASGAIMTLERLPRRTEFRCPECHASPPIGALWACPSCRSPVDAFASGGVCPQCRTALSETMCPDCQSVRPLRAWDARIIDA